MTKGTRLADEAAARRAATDAEIEASMAANVRECGECGRIIVNGECPSCDELVNAVKVNGDWYAFEEPLEMLACEVSPEQCDDCGGDSLLVTEKGLKCVKAVDVDGDDVAGTGCGRLFPWSKQPAYRCIFGW